MKQMGGSFSQVHLHNSFLAEGSSLELDQAASPDFPVEAGQQAAHLRDRHRPLHHHSHNSRRLPLTQVQSEDVSFALRTSG